MGTEPGITAVILTRGRPALLAECLGSFGAARPDEVIVGVDGGDPATEALLAGLPGVKTVLLPRSCRGEARNALAALASRRWLCFLDDDVVLPAGYFDRLRGLISRHPGAAVFGGGQGLHPAAGRFETAAYLLLSSPWGSGPFRPRFAPVEGEAGAGPEKFILCNLAVDSRFLGERGLRFEGHLSSAEENLLLNRMAAAGAGMVLSEGLNVAHRRRGGLAAFLAQVFQSARGRGQITALSPRGFCAFTLLPPLALLSAAALALLRPSALPPLAAAYAAACAGAALLTRAPLSARAALAPLFACLHAAYAAGWLAGLAEGAAGRLFPGVRPARCRCSDKP